MDKLPECVREQLIIITMPILILIMAPILLLFVISAIIVVIGLLLAVPFDVVLVLMYKFLNNRRLRK